MRRHFAIPWVFAIGAGSLGAQVPERGHDALPVMAREMAPASTPAILALDARIEAAVERLGARSQQWHEAIARVGALGRRVLLVTPDQVVVREASGAVDAFDSSTLAEASPIVGPDGSVDAVMVVLNVALLDSLHARLGSPRAEFEADLERLLAHEVYGHAVPYLLAGNVTGRCADPEPGERSADACSIRRENEIRREAGLGRRSDYELRGLALGRRLAWSASSHRR